MYSILIIDDEPIVKIALRSILPWEEHGFFICGTASNGLEAVPLIEKHHPDIIITDLKMPEMDGLELIRFLKEKEYPGEILVLSNYEDFDSVRSALLLGAADYLLKIKIQPDTLLPVGKTWRWKSCPDFIKKSASLNKRRSMQSGRWRDISEYALCPSSVSD
jgi:two-component system, response regulator YesN